jgi:hypothetical protein
MHKGQELSEVHSSLVPEGGQPPRITSKNSAPNLMLVKLQRQSHLSHAQRKIRSYFPLLDHPLSKFSKVGMLFDVRANVTRRLRNRGVDPLQRLFDPRGRALMPSLRRDSTRPVIRRIS